MVEIGANREFRILKQVFDAFKSNAELYKKAEMLNRIQLITLAVKAFQSLKNHAQNKRDKNHRNLVAYLKRVSWLKLVALIALRKHALVKQASSQIIAF